MRVHVSQIIILLLYASCLSIFAQSGWYRQSPIPTSQSLHDIQLLAPEDVWIVGNTGTILHSVDGGASWSDHSFATTNSVNAVHFMSPESGCVAGENGLIAITSDQGSFWLDQSSFGNATGLNDVFFTDTQNGWIVGDNGFVIHTENGGNSWVPQISDIVENINAVYFTTQDSGWAVGNGGRIIQTYNGGDTWTLAVSDTTADLFSVFFINSTEGWVSGDARLILHTIDGGMTWNTQDNPSGMVLQSIFFADRDHGWAAGGIGGFPSLVHTDDGGETWIAQISGVTYPYGLASVYAVDPDNCWLVGGGGNIARTTDGGNTWALVNNGTGMTLQTIQFYNNMIGWAMTPGGGIVHTRNGGETWTNIYSSGMLPLEDFTFISPDEGWQVGGQGMIGHTTDGGFTWDTQVTGGYTWWHAIHFADSLNGWIAGDSSIIWHTSDGGETWTRQNGPSIENLYSIIFTDMNTGWAAGDMGTILKTTDGGETWLPQLSNVYEQLNDIFFINPLEGWAVGGNGTIISSDDGGVIWQDHFTGLPETIGSISMINPVRGFAATDSGNILFTSDGWQTWNMQSTAEEPLNAIYFSDANQGWAAGGKGTIFHTVDGGGEPVPIIHLASGSIRFPQTRPGEFQELPFYIRNTGASDLTVLSKMIGGTDTSAFTIIQGEGPAVITPGDSQLVVLRFEPDSIGFKSASLLIESNVYGSPDSLILEGLCSFAGLALQVDGTNYITCSNDTSLDVHEFFTIEAWIRGDVVQPATANGYGRIIDKHNWADRQGYSIVRAPDYNSVMLDFYTTDGLQNTILGQTPVTDEHWHHVAAIYDGYTSYIYIDGLLESTKIVGPKQVNPSTNNLRIGANFDGSNWQHFGGEIDEVRIWRIARTQKQLVSTMMDTLSPTYYASRDSGLIGYWRFNAFEDLGVNTDGPDDVRDYTFNRNHGDADYYPTLVPSEAFSGITLLPNFQILSDSLSFAITGINRNRDLDVTILNSGNTILDISTTNLEGADAGAFSIVRGNAPLAVPAGGSQQLIIRFSPVTEGSKSGLLIIESNTPSSPDTLILTGTAVSNQGWYVQYSGDAFNYYDGHFLNANTGWVLDGSRVLHTSDGGYSWIVQETGNSDALVSTCFYDENRGWAVGANGAIIHTYDGGSTWSRQFSSVSGSLQSVHFATADSGWIAGPGGGIWFTVDGGNYWMDQASGTTNVLQDLFFLNSRSGWACGNQGTLLHTQDSGTNWIPQNSNTTNAIHSIHFNDPENGWAVGTNGTILHTSDGGNVWDIMNSGTTSELVSVCFVNQDTGWIAGANSTILFTEDGGTNWVPQVCPIEAPLWSIFFADESTGWITSAGTILHTIDGGGTGAAAAAEFSATYIHFQPTPVYESDDATITIQNTGDGSLVISEKILTGADPSNFAIIQGAGPSTIAAGDSEQVVIRFSPRSSSPKTAGMVILSNAQSSPDTIRLVGNDGMGVLITNAPCCKTNIEMTISPPRNFYPDTSIIFYRMGGEQTWHDGNLNPSGEDFIIQIDSTFSTIRGIEYYIYFRDHDQNVVTIPPVNPVLFPSIIQIQAGQMTTQVELPAEKYRMISVPLELSDGDPFSLLSDDYGDYDKKQWRLLHWNHLQEVYDEYPSMLAPFLPGYACWLITRSGTPFDLENGLSVRSDSPVSLTIQPGWNQIGNPFAFTIAWDSVANASRLNQPVYWNSDDYEYTRTELEPWEGYFVYNDSSDVVEIAFPPRESGSHLPKSSALPTVSPPEFIVQISAKGSESGEQDEQNFVGMLNAAMDGFDRTDFPQAPAIMKKLELSIIGKDRSYAGSFKTISTEGAFWDMQMSNIKHDNPVQITINNMGALPERFETWLLDLDRYKPLQIENNQIQLNKPNSDNILNFRLIIGTPEYAEQVNDGIPLQPLCFTLFQNYPNPFNASTIIRFQLAERSFVRFEIYNLLGQQIRTLVRSIMDTGLYEVAWDGLNDKGKQVGSGIYIYRIAAGPFCETRKMILIR